MSEREPEEIMENDSPHGTRVRYIGCSDEQVTFGGHADPRGILTEGDIYTVDCTDIHSWHTNVFLVNHPDRAFNSTCFTTVKE